jgi:hypothetical protein
VTAPIGAGRPSHTACITALFGTAALKTATICVGDVTIFSLSAGLEETNVVSARTGWASMNRPALRTTNRPKKAARNVRRGRVADEVAVSKDMITYNGSSPTPTEYGHMLNMGTRGFQDLWRM